MRGIVAVENKLSAVRIMPSFSILFLNLFLIVHFYNGKMILKITFVSNMVIPIFATLYKIHVAADSY